MRPNLLACALLLAVLPAAPALAQTATKAEERTVISSEGFLSAHPDLRHRLAGLRAYNKGDFAEAAVRFRRAARYADKPSQGMLAEMYWKGEGVEKDPALAYAWMDLAAERQYPMMLAKREHYWEKLDEAGRERALTVGEEVYAEYGDEVAKPRLARELRMARSRTTGSRTGFVGSLQITIPTPNGDVTVDGSTYYDEKFWDLEKYIEWHDGDWTYYAEGTVDVGDVMATDKDKAKSDEAAEAAYEAEQAEDSGED